MISAFFSTSSRFSRSKNSCLLSCKYDKSWILSIFSEKNVEFAIIFWISALIRRKYAKNSAFKQRISSVRTEIIGFIENSSGFIGFSRIFANFRFSSSRFAENFSAEIRFSAKIREISSSFFDKQEKMKKF